MILKMKSTTSKAKGYILFVIFVLETGHSFRKIYPHCGGGGEARWTRAAYRRIEWP
jgi:hypothetical protein